MYLSINNLDMFQETNENVSDYGGHSGFRRRESTLMSPGKSGSC